MKLLLVIFSILIAKAFPYPSPSNEIESKWNWPSLFKPSFRPENDVKFLLFTRRNPFVGQQILLGDLRSLLESNFNISNPTRFLIHGWGESSSFFSVETTDAFLQHSDFNVISVDWSLGSKTLNYLAARNRAILVGRLVGEFIDFLDEQKAIKFSELTVVGFSLGAHVAGFAGKNLQRGRINTIIGLDPANPFFYLRNPDGRLDFTDAEYVEVIHTNSRMAGLGFPIAHADFFVSNGSRQPGCFTNSCSHDRAPLLFIESINSNNFFADRCESLSDIDRGCSDSPLIKMGGEPSNSRLNIQGIFHLTTNRFSPFAQGKPTVSNLP